MGRQRYPMARGLTITADCGGSNGARVRLWKVELQKLADETGRKRPVCGAEPKPIGRRASAGKRQSTGRRTAVAWAISDRLAR